MVREKYLNNLFLQLIKKSYLKKKANKIKIIPTTNDQNIEMYECISIIVFYILYSITLKL